MKLTLKNIKATLTAIDAEAKTVNLVVDGAAKLNIKFEGEPVEAALLSTIYTDAEGVVSTKPAAAKEEKKSSGKGSAFAAKY